MPNRYYRYVGTTSDVNWRLISRECGVPTPYVIAVWGALEERAADRRDPSLVGWIGDVSYEAIALLCDIAPAHVATIVTLIHNTGKLCDGWIVDFAKRLPRNMTGAARMARYRKRKYEAALIAQSSVTSVTSVTNSVTQPQMSGGHVNNSVTHHLTPRYKSHESNEPSLSEIEPEPEKIAQSSVTNVTRRPKSSVAVQKDAELQRPVAETASRPRARIATLDSVESTKLDSSGRAASPHAPPPRERAAPASQLQSFADGSKTATGKRSRKSSKPSKRQPMPDDFTLTRQMRESAKKALPPRTSVLALFARWCDQCRSSRRRELDWVGAWQRHVVEMADQTDGDGTDGNTDRGASRSAALQSPSAARQ